MNSISIRAFALSLVLLLVLPSVAQACPIAFRTLGPLAIQKGEVTRPVIRNVPRTAWRVDDTWTSTRPELNQDILARGIGVYRGATYRRQRALSIDAAAPSDNGWVYADDHDPATPRCAMAGRPEWRKPVIMLRETRRVIRIAAVARRTVGDRAGCVLGGDQDASEWGCPTLTRAVLKLKRPVGERRLVFEVLAAPRAAGQASASQAAASSAA